jgi:glycosyltransferase involved in cell wall biosynthesis
LFLGRISSYKGIEILIEAWKDRTQVPNSKLYIVGPIAIDSPLNLIVEDSSIIVKPGTLKPEEYLAMTDVFVLPSMGEGMSNSLLEAMSFGKAVIATRVGAAEELIENNYSGLLVDPANVSQLKTALNAFLLDLILRKECGVNAQTKSQEYAITNVTSAIDSRYQQLLNQNKSFLRNFKY